jgi:succinate-semialdehyde dehydrogenase/glutarate-semialdehyde dehydrogenase
MAFKTINPATGELVAEHLGWGETEIERALALAATAAPAWATSPMGERSRLLRELAGLLRGRSDKLARLVTMEMGKLLREAQAEVEKCASGCEFYADHGPAFLADEPIASDAARSYVAYQPLGTVLAIMPWNFPLWQVFRFAAPALLAGNTALLKHASNVHLCSLAIQDLFHDAGFPAGVFQHLMIGASKVPRVIHDPRVHAITLTGSDAAGRKVAAEAGAALKKTVMELGGSDPFIVLGDADLDLTVPEAVKARFQNAGQSCIAGKRFIVVDAIADAFVARFKAAVEQLRPGDPMADATTLAPMVRADQRQALHEQVVASIARGAVAVTGGHPLAGAGFFYAPTILDRVAPGMRAYHEELFGPVAAVIRARDEADALRLANDSPFGLGGSIWTRDRARGEALALRLACGCAFVNGIVKSDPRLPFGGVKASGYGRELSRHGLHEFVNAKTVWVG